MNLYVEAVISDLEESWRPLALKVLEDCMNPPRGEPPFNEDEINQAAYELAKAIHDCAALDTWDGGEFFTDRFRAAMSEPRAYLGLAWKIMDEPDRKKTKPLEVAFRKGPDFYAAARAIHDLREYVRDGVTVAEALSWMGQRFHAIAESASGLEFFKKALPDALHDILTKPERYQRQLRGWIKRAWIPLALWRDFENPQRVHDILIRAGDTYPPLRGIGLKYDTEFLPAWNKIKPKKKRGI